MIFHRFTAKPYTRILTIVLVSLISVNLPVSSLLPVRAAAHSPASQTVSEITVVFDANGGKGSMDSQIIQVSDAEDTGSSSVSLTPCTFTRYGYIFRGWMTSPDGTQCEIEDQSAIPADILNSSGGTSSLTLYALWEPQMYIIHYDPDGASLGEMPDSYGIYDQTSRLSQNLFVNPAHLFRQWIDTNTGRFYEDRQQILNLHSGNTYSRAVISVDAGKPENKDYSFRSTQGSCVFEEDGIMYLVAAASINDSAYNNGDLSHYETILTKYNIATGEVVKQVRNLQFDHGNGICYNPNNRHLYIAEGGTVSGYPSGVMEVDEELEEVKEYNFPLLTHVWGIAYADGHFYLIGRNDDSRNSFCVLNEDMQTLSITPVDEYYAQNFSSQGIASDGSFIYAVSAGFKAYDWKSKQRINVFSTSGEYLGVWTIDIPYEAEDLTIVGPYAYITTNEGSRCTLYRTRIPAVTLHALWK